MIKLLLLSAILTALSAKSQTSVYHPFPDRNAYWNINLSQPMCFMGFAYEDYSITISGDTIINNQLYHKLTTPYVQAYITGNCTQQNFPGYQGAIRQDIINKKVFYVPPAQLTEQILYDFTLEVGDTVKGYLQTFNSTPDIVVEIDSVLIGNNYHKRWLINPCYEIYLIEGVGSTFGLLKFSLGCITDMDSYFLNCFSQEGQVLYPDTFTDCQLNTSVLNNGIISDQINIYPNPSDGSFTVDLGQPNDIKEIRLTNMIGNIVFRKQISNQNKVNIDNLPGGAYIFTIINKENRTTNRKAISCP